MKKKKIPELLFFLLSFFLIMFLTFQNAQKSGELSELVLRYLSGFLEATGLNTFFPGHEMLSLPVRKLAHTAEYFLLGISSMLLFRDSKKGFWKAAALCAVISFADQVTKSFLPGREFDWTDFPYDIVGYAAGIAIVFLFVKKKRKQEEDG